MHSKLGGGHRKNEPASARVNRRQAEHVPEERTDLLCLGREHDRMHASDHAAILAAYRAWLSGPAAGTPDRAAASKPQGPRHAGPGMEAAMLHGVRRRTGPAVACALAAWSLAACSSPAAPLASPGRPSP